MPKTKSKIRVRFAPSPTGFLHVGGLRTALYNYLFAHQKKGVFILRIEDTDQTRVVPGAIEGLLRTLKAMGLEWDEGPFIKSQIPNPKLQINLKSQNSKFKIVEIREKGRFWPYVQSKRLEIYKKYVQELVEKGKAYYCFCSPERLEKMRKEQELKKLPTMYDGHCRPPSLRGPRPARCGAGGRSNLDGIASPRFGGARNDKKEIPHVIRLAVPREGETEFTDLIRGQVKFENKLIDDQVLLKSDGFPTYHLANVVDDHLMKISHVIRGEDWLSSTPKHILLYQAFGWTPPQFAHITLLLNPDRSKLSKRQGDAAVENYLEKGYLPEALLNFVALLGWSSAREPDREIFTLSELIKEFSLERISPSGAIFNLEKLDWLNSHYIKQKPVGELVELCLPYLVEAGLVNKSEILNFSAKGVRPRPIRLGRRSALGGKSKISRVIKLEQERLKKLSDLPALVEFFFKMPEYPAKLLVWRKSNASTTRDRLARLSAFYDGWKKKWDKKSLEQGTLKLIKKENLDNGATLWPMRVALSGREASPGPFEIAEILGKEETVKRLNLSLYLISNI